MLTSLYLTKVLPASTPSAALNIIVMVGPSLIIRWIAIPIATTAAKIGMTQTMEIRVCLLGCTVAWGKLSRSMISAMLIAPVYAGIQNQTRVEKLRRKHRDCHGLIRDDQYNF